MVKPGGYRADIDGLRAIAVAAVVLFHAGAPLPGGFVGVDVFFVISGYLITSLVAADLDADRFSIARFWERRIRRIWPASLVVIAATLVTGWFVLLPRDYRAVGTAALAQVALLSNVASWIKTDYFAEWGELDPLLHMWSLSVEEQFYVVLPVLMMHAWPLGRTWCIVILACLAGASFVAGVLGIDRDPMAVFYLLPFRSWELLVGSLLALCPLPKEPPGWQREVLGVAGLFMILHPCLSYDRTTMFPGWAAVEPCLGAVALIAAGNGRGSAVNRLLATLPLQRLGQMSYSVYLWHWPLLAFLRYAVSPVLPASFVVASMTFMIPLSWMSYRWIETPPRTPSSDCTRQRITLVTVLAAVTVGVCGIVIRASEGMPFRFSQRVLEVLAVEPFCRDWESRTDASEGEGIEFKPIGRSRPCAAACFFLWGDSHGMAISPVVDAVARELGMSGHAALKLDTPPFPQGIPDPGAGPAASRGWYEETLAWVGLHHPRHIILCARWSYYMRGSVPDGARRQADAAVAGEVDRQTGARIAAVRNHFEAVVRTCERSGTILWVLLEVPYQPRTPRERALEAHWKGGAPSLSGIDRTTHERSVESFRKAIAGIASPALRVIDLASPFFGDEDRSMVGRNGMLWYADDDHLGPSGAQAILGPTVRGMLAEIGRDCGESEERDPAAGGSGSGGRTRVQSEPGR